MQSGEHKFTYWINTRKHPKIWLWFWKIFATIFIYRRASSNITYTDKMPTELAAYPESLLASEGINKTRKLSNSWAHSTYVCFTLAGPAGLDPAGYM